jgi:hypothetical protein
MEITRGIGAILGREEDSAVQVSLLLANQLSPVGAFL